MMQAIRYDCCYALRVRHNDNSLGGIMPCTPRAVAPALVLFGWLAGSPAFGDVTFTDGTFNPADYTATASFASNGTISGAQCASCGNPGEALRFPASFGDTTQTSALSDLGFVNTTFLFDPSTQGRIVSISASVDKDLSTDLTPLPGTLFGNTFRPMIGQGGLFYLAAIAGPLWSGGDTGFLTLSASPLLPSSFQQFDFATGTFLSGQPDFAGGPMLFGIGQIFSAGGLPAGQFTAIYDNFSIQITVPEPPGLWLTSLGLALAAAFGMRRVKAYPS
jgi:hypothetical protein